MWHPRMWYAPSVGHPPLPILVTETPVDIAGYMQVGLDELLKNQITPMITSKRIPIGW